MSGERSDGLLHALVLDGAGGAVLLDEPALSAWQSGQTGLWVHVDLNEEAGRDWIERHSGLDAASIEALLEEDTRPRTSTQGDELLLTLRGINLNPGQDPEDMVAVRIWCDGRRIITARRRRLLSVAAVSEILAAGRGPPTAGGLLAHLAEALIDRLSDFVDAAESQADEIEESAIGDAGRERQTELAELRRQTIAIRRFLSPQRDALARLQDAELSWLAEEDRSALRETQNRLLRCIEAMDAVRDRATVTQDQIRGQLSEQLNRRMYVLSIITAIFLPMSFLTGLLGVNLGGIPGADSHWGFAIFVAGLIVLGALGAWMFLRSRGSTRLRKNTGSAQETVRSRGFSSRMSAESAFRGRWLSDSSSSYHSARTGELRRA